MKMKSPSSSSSQTHTFSCISLFLQKLLCSGASFTYPSDQITEPGFESPEFVDEPGRARGGEPGAVARLMGLDSVPVTDKTRVLSRSRSVVNSGGDYLKREDDEIQGKQHRRVKSSLEYVELEDDNFFILSFEKDSRNDKALGELKQLRARKYKKKREARENQTHIEEKENDINAMNVSTGRKRPETGELKQRRYEKRKNMRKRREVKLRQNIKNYGRWSRDGDLTNCEVKSMKEEEEECRSCDDSSPVSVLDYDRVTPEPENTSRRRLSSVLESSKSIETVHEDQRSRESEIRVHGNQETWLMICRLTLSELEESNSVYRRASKLGDLEGSISEDIASNILDQLLEETITTLSLTPQV